MVKGCSNSSLHIRFTQRFCVLEVTNGQRYAHTSLGGKVDLSSIANSEFPVISLYDILVTHGSIRRRPSLHSNEATTPNRVRQQLYDGLVRHGFVLISIPNGRAATVIRDMRTSLCDDLFPVVGGNHSTHLETSPTIYVSERGIPMYKLGYEACEDRVREVFRVAAGDHDSVVWPPSNRSTTSNIHDMDQNENACSKSIWMRGLGFLRHVSDAALDLLLQHKNETEEVGSSAPIQRRHHRPHSGASAWWHQVHVNNSSFVRSKQERTGDFSVLYAMHYFNNDISGTVEPGVAVKAHIDPSLLVIEPFLCTDTSGLQVWDRSSKVNGSWMDCDGPSSPLQSFVLDAMRRDEELMLLFSGKALSTTLPSIEPTLHRVVSGMQPRRTVIYEQKYAEFYPLPSFD